MSDISKLDPVEAGRNFARKVGALDSTALRNIRANAQSLLASADQIEKWTGEYHIAFCDELESVTK